MTSPFLYFPDDGLSEAELIAARLDGHLVEVGEAFMPADAVETAALRAGSLRSLASPGLAVTHVSAAWVHGALDEPPARHVLQRISAQRLHHIMSTRLQYRDGRLPRSDVVVLAGIAVTTVERTLADLVRADIARGCEPAGAARRMIAAYPPSPVDAMRLLREAGAVPFKRPAIAWLATYAADYDEVTR